MNTENESEKSMSFLPFRHCIREPHGSAVKFEILAATSNEFQVRYPDYDYIKMGAGPSVMYNREQLLCFLLAYDKAECLEFMEKLYHHMGWPAEKLYANPAFAGVGKEKKT